MRMTAKAKVEMLGRAVLQAVKIAAAARCPVPAERDEFADALVLGTLSRALKWKPGSVSLEKYCVGSAYFAAADLLRRRRVIRDAMDTRPLNLEKALEPGEDSEEE